MNIEHITIWTRQFEALKTFYKTYFGAHVNQKYANHKKHFEFFFDIFKWRTARGHANTRG